MGDQGKRIETAEGGTKLRVLPRPSQIVHDVSGSVQAPQRVFEPLPSVYLLFEQTLGLHAPAVRSLFGENGNVEEKDVSLGKHM